MLLRPDAVYLDKATNQLERVFPRGTDWQVFESKFPAKEVFENSVLDPAVGLGGELAMRAFAAADWQNWISTAKIGLYEIGTRVGLPDLKNNQALNTGLALVYDNISSTLNTITSHDDPAEMIPELIQNTAMQVMQMLVGQNMVLQVVLQVLAVAAWAIEVVGDHRASLLAKDVPLPPLQSEDPATDSWQVNRVFELIRTRGTGGVVFPDGKVEPASNADLTNLYLPAYTYNLNWTIQHREHGVAAQQGYPSEARGPLGDTTYNFDVGDASTFGFMPGTTTSLRVLQASYRFYQTLRGTPVNRYTIRCNGIKKSCKKSVKAFDGGRDCRQCVTAESVWPVQGIGWAYGGAPLNATTPGENVGAFYPSTNKLLGNLLDMIARPGPLLYTINVQEIHSQWKRTFEKFWEFCRSEWHTHHGVGWRGLISRLATIMTVFEFEDELRIGGRDRDMPLKLIANPREREFEIEFSNSIFSRIIEPYCETLAKLHLEQLDTFGVAYVPPGAGALYSPNGKIRRNGLGDQFMSARRALLASNKRVLVDLRQVSDPEYRAELERVGVKASPVNPALHGSPGVSGHEILRPSIKPRRAPIWPKVARLSPLASAVDLSAAAKRARPPRARPLTRSPTLGESKAAGDDPASRTRVGIGVAAGGALLTVAGLWRLHRMTDD